MKNPFKRLLSGLLALALVLSLCPAAMLPAAEAATVSANVALGKSVAFSYGSEVTSDSNYGVSAVKAGLSVLTDGDKANTNWWVNNGNPYVGLKSSVITGPYIFSVDLGSSYDTDQVAIYCYGRTDNWTVYPTDSVTYTISSDGSTWKTLGTVELADAVVNTVADPRYPGSYVNIYQFILPVQATGRYVRATFDTNAAGLVGVGEFEVCGTPLPTLISEDCSFTYFGHGTEVGSDANWGSGAVEAGLSVLTDGETASPNWWVNNGNPNIGLDPAILPGDYVFNLDLGGSALVNRVGAYFYSRTAWGVDAPEAVTFSVSTDGRLWTQVATVDKASASTSTIEDSRNPDDQKPTIYHFSADIQKQDARYVKVSFGANADSKIGVQEIQVYGTRRTITNLAQGKLANSANYTYQVTGGGTGYESTGTTKEDGTRYTVTEVENASLSRLTDGSVINASAVGYPANWASYAWNSSGAIMSKYMQIYRNDSRILTLDLGAVRNVTGIRMHFAAVESMGFYMPTNVTYYVSENGVDYYLAADVWNYQATADSNDSNISCSGTPPRHSWYPASGINFNARYIKISFPVNVYILSDELQVFGSDILSTSATDLTSCEKYDPLEKYVGDFATIANSGGVKNEFMAYSGWYINSDGNEVYNTYKTVDEYMTSITYIDENGVPQDWLFDDVTVMGHYYTSRGTFNSYKAGYTEGKYYANQDDWYEWLCYAFGKDANGNDLSYEGNSVINLEALEAAAASAKATLNDPDYKVGVKLVLFPAVEYQEDWGYINGQHIDFTIDGCGSQEKALENRTKAYQWYIDQAVAMWEDAGFQHLELTGFYYYEETIHESTDRIAKAATQALTDIVHTHATPSTNTRPAFDSDQGGRLYIYQLPFYQSEGYWNWAEYGFDYALMQPNYSFYDMYTLTQLEECAGLCEYYGLGMQMEFGGTASTTYHDKFEDYLTYGVKYGYQRAILSWYMSTWGCYSMAYDNNGTRYLYDMVYDFVKTQNANLVEDCTHGDHTVDGVCFYCEQTVEHTYENCVCTLCGYVTEHDYTAVTVEPTCTAPGYTTYTCTLCGDSYTGDEVAASGHSYADATCTAPKTCTVCGATDGEALGHDWLDADCTTPMTCDLCGTTSGEALGHDWTDADCTTPMTCDLCGTTSGEALGHDWTDADCTTPMTCSVCGATSGEAAGHDYTATVIPPTCTEGGFTTYTCTACGHSYTGDATAATGHDWTAGICGTCGTVCDHAYTETVKAPTCTADGYTTYLCTKCNDLYVGNTVPALGHSYENGSCTVCGEADPDYSVTAPTIQPLGPGLAFKDEIYYNVYFGVNNPDNVEIVEMGVMTWTSAIDGTVETAEHVCPGTEPYYTTYFKARTQPISAKNMGEELYIKIYLKLADGTYVYSSLLNYSAKTYAANKINDANSSDSLKALCVALMNYGAAAQEYFGYKTDELMNAGLTDEQKALVEGYSDSMIPALVQPGDKASGLAWTGGYSALAPSVNFGGALGINYTFTPNKTMDGEMKLYIWTESDLTNNDALTLENASQVITMTAVGDGSYTARSGGIAAKNAGDTIYACGVYESNGEICRTGVLAYSVAAYCQSYATRDHAFQPMAATAAVYTYYANAYLGS